MLQSWLHWNLIQHYLDDFITIIPAALAHTIPQMETDYIAITDILGIPRNDKKNQSGSIISVLGLEIDTNLFTLRVPEDKMERAFKATSQALQQESITLKEIEALAGFLGFCAPAVQLGRFHLRTIWSFVASYPQNKSHFIKRRIPAEVCEDLTWWRDLFPSWNRVLFFQDSTRDTISLFTDSSGFGMGGFHVLGRVNTESVNYSAISYKNGFAASILPFESQFDINLHEMEAVLFTFHQWGHQ